MSKQPEASSVRVKIYDREYAFRTTGDPDRLMALCANLDKRMRELTKTSGSVDTLKLAILVALSYADDLQKILEELKKLDESVGRRALACTSLLERIIP